MNIMEMNLEQLQELSGSINNAKDNQDKSRYWLILAMRDIYFGVDPGFAIACAIEHLNNPLETLKTIAEAAYEERKRKENNRRAIQGISLLRPTNATKRLC